MSHPLIKENICVKRKISFKDLWTISLTLEKTSGQNYENVVQFQVSKSSTQKCFQYIKCYLESGDMTFFYGKDTPLEFVQFCEVSFQSKVPVKS